jgi:hypothetical protein
VRLKVYVENSVFSVIVARPPKDRAMAERQQQTRDWWQTDAETFDLFASETVRSEAMKGDKEMARRRLELIDSIPILPNTVEGESLGRGLITAGVLPPKAMLDAIHLGVATWHKMDFLVTWNCVHLSNGVILRQVMKRWHPLGYDVPQVITPPQLMGAMP